MVSYRPIPRLRAVYLPADGAHPPAGISVGTALVADGSSRKDSVDRFHKADSKKAGLKTTLVPSSDVCV